MTKVLSEIIEYADQPGVSYYDLKRYAYENEKEDWIECLNTKKYRQFISIFIKDRRKTDGVKYQSKYLDGMISAEEAKIKYLEKKGVN